MLFVQQQENSKLRIQIENINYFEKIINEKSISIGFFFINKDELYFHYNTREELEHAIKQLNYIIGKYDKGVYIIDKINIPNYIEDLEIYQKELLNESINGELGMLRNVEKPKMRDVYDIGGNL